MNCIICNKKLIYNKYLGDCFDCNIFYYLDTWFRSWNNNCKYSQNELDRIIKLKAFI